MHDMIDRPNDHAVVGEALKEALANGWLTLCYQPQVNLYDGSLHAVEALLRWSHPVLGDVSTGRSIHVAEQMGLIEEIGIWGLREACRQMAEWRAAGRNVPAVSVNLSPTHFCNRELPAIIACLLNEYGIPAHALTVEITEGVKLDDDPMTFATIDAIRELGVGLSMDDFGTGYSDLSRLTQVPFTELKIDRSFVSRLCEDGGARAVVIAVNEIGCGLDIIVVAEGVETEQQRSMLERLGCRIGQGHLFGRPMKPSELEDWLVSSRQAPVMILPFSDHALYQPA
ncbi:putative bifunctional diguanylate cyclase/phosphodiesterase [Labrys miyagiensis]|nr:EAL domain-containing protein [Labrys miyagiensis]